MTDGVVIVRVKDTHVRGEVKGCFSPEQALMLIDGLAEMQKRLVYFVMSSDAKKLLITRKGGETP